MKVYQVTVGRMQSILEGMVVAWVARAHAVDEATFVRLRRSRLGRVADLVVWLWRPLMIGAFLTALGAASALCFVEISLVSGEMNRLGAGNVVALLVVANTFVVMWGSHALVTVMYGLRKAATVLVRRYEGTG